MIKFFNLSFTFWNRNVITSLPPFPESMKPSILFPEKPAHLSDAFWTAMVISIIVFLRQSLMQTTEDHVTWKSLELCSYRFYLLSAVCTTTPIFSCNFRVHRIENSFWNGRSQRHSGQRAQEYFGSVEAMWVYFKCNYYALINLALIGCSL